MVDPRLWVSFPFADVTSKWTAGPVYAYHQSSDLTVVMPPSAQFEGDGRPVPGSARGAKLKSWVGGQNAFRYYEP
jgi:hypothetical protein